MFNWKNVFHGEYLLRFGHVDNFYKQAVQYTGYPYFLWNDRIYKVINRVY